MIQLFAVNLIVDMFSSGSYVSISKVFNFSKGLGEISINKVRNLCVFLPSCTAKAKLLIYLFIKLCPYFALRCISKSQISPKIGPSFMFSK